MLNTIVKIIGALLCGITITYTTNNMLKKAKENFSLKLVLIVFLISAITYFSYGIKYNAESNLFRIILYILAFKLVYNETSYKAIISVIISMAILSCCDMISSLIFISFLTADQMRGIWYWILICNFIVCFMTCSVASIKPIKNKLRNFVLNLNENSIFSSIFLLVMSTIVIVSLFYNISRNYEWSEKYIINVIISITYFAIIIIFLRDRIEYNNLITQYDCLFEYFKELEDNIDEISLVNHEYKNQLSVLKSYIKNNNKKEAINYINDIIKTTNIEDKALISTLKNIPRGGIKGLLYYKIITAKNKKTQIVLDTNKEVTRYLEKLSSEDNKILSKLLGVYIDNAIEEVSLLNKKIVNIEIYVLNNYINIIISNPIFHNNINLDEIKKNGYTTKGKGRGKGLYLANKIINKTKCMETETKIINNYFIQRIIIKK